MRTPLLLVALLSVTAMAGCLSGGSDDATVGPDGDLLARLSPAVYSILPPEEVWVASSVDGQRLHNVVYRPDTDGKVPVWVNFSPYWGDSADDEGDNFAMYMIHEYVPRGYAVVLSALRGTGHSEGCFQIGGDLEIEDAYDVVDFFSKAEWSTGSLASGGKSYDSTTQNALIAKNPHPALKGIFHVSGITDMYSYNYRNGVTYGTQGIAFNALYWQQTLHEYGLDNENEDDLVGVGAPEDAASPDDEDADSLARAIGDAACPEMPGIQANGLLSAVSGLRTDYWVERDWTRHVADSNWTGSIFFVHGLQDWNVKPDHILPWLQNLPDTIDVRGWIHYANYTPPHSGHGHVYPMRTDWNLTMLRWLDQVLKGIDTGLLLEPAFQIEGTDEVWRWETAWPPARGSRLVFTPEADGTSLQLLQAGDEPLRVSGAPTLNVTATTNNLDPVLSAVMYDVSPSGQVVWANEAVLRGVLADSLEMATPLPPGTTREYLLTFFPMDRVVQPGHALIVELGAATTYTLATPAQMAGIEYDLSSAQADLRLVPTDHIVSPQPEDMFCFAC